MDFVSRHIIERVARRRVGQISDVVAAMIGIDQRRQTGRFTSKAGEYDAAPVLIHQGGKKFAGKARGAAAFKYHLVALRLEAFNPANEWRRPVEKRRIIEQADKCYR